MTRQAERVEAALTSGGAAEPSPILSEGADIEPVGARDRIFSGRLAYLFGGLCVVYTLFHLFVMNVYPVEQWTYRIMHVAGGLMLGFMLTSSWSWEIDRRGPSPLRRSRLEWPLAIASSVLIGGAFVLQGYALVMKWDDPMAVLPPLVANGYGLPLLIGVALAGIGAWAGGCGQRGGLHWCDALLALASVTVALYLIANINILRMRAGTPLSTPGDVYAALVGTLLILEITRRVAGLALVIIAGVFLVYCFVGPYMPGFLHHSGYSLDRTITYIYSDNGILGPTTAMSSTYIILFVTFAAFLQVSKVGDYFVNFAFAAAGRTRGGPAKVAVFASGLMGMINGTSAGNVVSTGSLTIPLMKRVGYRGQTAAAIEAAASSGGQIMPPIMGAGAFIMAEITGLPYSEIVIAAIIPSIFYFVSVFLMVDFEALKRGMKGLPRSELPRFGALARQVYLFTPVIILIYALFMGYSVIRAGTLAMAAAAMVSWLTPFRMGPRQILLALKMAAQMSLQLVAVCACAGIIVGVISLTGVGSRFASILLAVSGHSHVLALIFAMFLAMILGMGMPTTAAYTIAASVIGPGLVQSGIAPLTAHFFIFYFAVMSAITPPVALAAYAGAALAKSNPMKTSVESFRIGLAAFIVPFMFFSSPALLMQGEFADIAHVSITGLIGILMLSSAVAGYCFGEMNPLLRLMLFAGALAMIDGGVVTDLSGIALGLVVVLFQKWQQGLRLERSRIT
ncbi:TRAP transporter permease [Limimaricola cinnabarinus]|uniref:TRAP transporter permease n=1 Tax=Limimaricola cinnabarinus TaxID=1125964 RepID=UPI002492D2EE|nr:TRAP transporter permease [Limimaricola cinnabarinus]